MTVDGSTGDQTGCPYYSAARRESGIGNRESGIGNRESGIGNRVIADYIANFVKIDYFGVALGRVETNKLARGDRHK
ncbi:hypothetical protein [Moorena sp. SIO4G3]|uniref:hypothetical protein n=1 Tax=Moorena sp. SIO4G3 TaxID=2607821 RepID=UPI0014297839|nr:hypothetical protein [Moorena sp. SIO4G3]NEO75902.1 hypothetical protein [Moorena sp. SIO4G3]